MTLWLLNNEQDFACRTEEYNEHELKMAMVRPRIEPETFRTKAEYLTLERIS
jgi:hypothetical protein